MLFAADDLLKIPLRLLAYLWWSDIGHGGTR